MTVPWSNLCASPGGYVERVIAGETLDIAWRRRARWRLRGSTKADRRLPQVQIADLADRPTHVRHLLLDRSGVGLVRDGVLVAVLVSAI